MDSGALLSHAGMAMTVFPITFYMMCALVLAVAGWGILTGTRLLELPVILSLFAIAWLIPEGITAERAQPWSHPGDTLFWGYVTACLAIEFLFFYIGKAAAANWREGRGRRRQLPTYRFERLVWFAAGLMAVGVVANVLMMHAASEFRPNQVWTGVITLYELLSSASTLGLLLAALLYFRTREKAPLIIGIICLVTLFPALATGIKRVGVFDIAVATGGSYFMIRRIFPPRMLVAAAAILGTLLLHQVGELRSVRNQGGSVTEYIMSGAPFEQFSYFHSPEAYEIEQAKSDFTYVRQNDYLTYGAVYWNGLVKQYVPAFALGRNFKDSLFLASIANLARQGNYSLVFSSGATRTGFSDSFSSFSYFGVLVFALLGFLGGLLYHGAMGGRIVAQFYYLAFIGQFIMAITHSTHHFLSAGLYILALTLPGFALARDDQVDFTIRALRPGAPSGLQPA